MDLPTYTNIWRIEKRLYKLYDFRLPAPLPITWIGVFVGITVPYVVFLIAVGVPFNHTLLWLYILPPGVLTWLTTRPVIEGKRLPELVTSQARYITEPRAWCRMVPFAEKDQISVRARVWHGHPPKVRPEKVPAPARPGAAAPQAASAVADGAERAAASSSVTAQAPGLVLPPSAHVPVRARASAWPAATPVTAAPRARPAWSPWPRGSAPSPAAGTPDTGTLELSHDPEPAGDVGSPRDPAAELPEARAGAPERDAGGFRLPAEASGTIIVTPGQLQGIRGWWRELAPAAAALRELGFTGEGDRVAAIAYAIGTAGFAVHVPCVTCRTPTPVQVGVGDQDHPEPSGVACGTCGTEIDWRALADPAGCGDPSWRRQVELAPGGHGPGKQAQEALARDRARLPLADPRRIAVLGCSRGAGQTLTALMTGHVLAALRGAAVAAVDLNPGATSLAARCAPAVSARDVLGGGLPCEQTDGSGERLDVVADLPGANGSRLDPDDYQRLAGLLGERYPLTVIDPAPAGLTRVLPLADQLVLVAPASPAAATSLAKTQQWLGEHGYGELARRAVTVVNGVSRRTMEDVLRAESVARDQCRAIVRVPWDDLLFARLGPSPVSHPERAVNPQTRMAYAELAGALVTALATDSASTVGEGNPGEHLD